MEELNQNDHCLNLLKSRKDSFNIMREQVITDEHKNMVQDRINRSSSMETQ